MVRKKEMYQKDLKGVGEMMNKIVDNNNCKPGKSVRNIISCTFLIVRCADRVCKKLLYAGLVIRQLASDATSTILNSLFVVSFCCHQGRYRITA